MDLPNSTSLIPPLGSLFTQIASIEDNRSQLSAVFASPEKVLSRYSVKLRAGSSSGIWAPMASLKNNSAIIMSLAWHAKTI